MFLLLLTVAPWIAKGYLQFFLAQWTQAADQNKAHFQFLFALIIVLHIVFAIMSSLLIYLIILGISSKLHQRMIQSVIRAKPNFFFYNPFGTIITRFSKDTSVLDLVIPFQILLFVDVFWRCVLAVGLSALAFPYILIFLVFLLPLLIFLRQLSLTLSLQSMKLDALTRSPINDFFAASYQGRFTIKIYNQEQKLISKFDKLVDQNAKALFTVEAANRWLAFYLDCLVSLYLLAIVIAVVVNAQNLKEQANYVGISLSMSMELAGLCHYLITITSQIANSLTSFKRMKAYIDLEPQQYSLKSQSWKRDARPSIVFNNVRVRYREGLEPVLDSITLKIKAGARVGIVGRTGSGKSSLLATLLKFVTPEEGKVEIFRSDISKISVNSIRQEIAVITQEAFLIDTTVRRNIDFEGLKSEQEIQEIIARVQLRQKINSLPQGLDTRVSQQNAEIFSAGERQLLCLARALIQNKHILLMDEVTANVDRKTDVLIKRILQDHFRHKTVITVAHRLSSIIDYDEVFVMENGQIIERGRPLALMVNSQEDREITKRGSFAELVKSTGRKESERLLSEARRVMVTG